MHFSWVTNQTIKNKEQEGTFGSILNNQQEETCLNIALFLLLFFLNTFQIPLVESAYNSLKFQLSVC